MTAQRLTDEELALRLRQLPGWQRDGDELVRVYRFASFRAAFAFMSAVAEVAERLDHHPDWQNVYSRVAIRLTTHDSGGITSLDCEMARAMVDLAAEHGGE